MAKLTFALTVLAFVACVEEELPYVGEDCPPSTEAGAECRQGDLTDTCRELFPGHNRIEPTNSGFGKRSINLVFVGLNQTPDEAYTVFREDLQRFMKEDFFAENGSIINYWYIPQTFEGIEHEGYNGRGAEGDFIAWNLANECLLENRHIIKYSNWNFRSNAYLNMIFLSRLDDKEIRAIIGARNNLPWDISCDESIEECWGKDDCIYNEFFPEEDYIIHEATRLVCNHDYYHNTIARISLPIYNSVTLHELGHSLYGIHDEYVDEKKVKPQVIDFFKEHPTNCFVGSKEECMENTPWKEYIDITHRGQKVGCYEGCGYMAEGIYRATKNGLMKNSGSEKGYGLPNEIHACRALSIFTNKTTEYCANLDPLLYGFEMAELKE